MASHQIRHVATHLLTPLLMCLGMGLAYLGAFHQPEPNHLAVAVVGDNPQAMVLAQTLKDQGGKALDVITVPDRDAAVAQLKNRDLAGAFVPDAQHPELLVAKAGSDTTAMATELVFQQVTDKQGVALTVTDVTSPASGDPTAQGIFFLLVALSIGSYGSVAAIGAAGAGLPMWIRALFGLVTSFIVSLIGLAVAGPVFHVVDHDLGAVWAMSWLYSAGVLAIGIGLHTYLQRWTTLAMMVLFVMLNFTSSGGVYSPWLQNDFFGTLHGFWNGAGFMEGARSLLYFDGAGFGSRILSLVLWFAAGLLLIALAGRTEKRRAATAPRQAVHPDARAAAEEEMEESVGV
ncbi:hypothetical protein H0264_16600 [Nocardia huaxiensis]|uniref:Uncharacterized protein n=1 Tax=Nocardia huaxiensis TaxID=2755382 RepID=A0A7D6VEL2_9NOCA|nr:hypothetical protein [Nocardia huaxiensis]QLY33634.1 hypothetical protein H0264_16600 [Nocardia huaxiensis]